MTNGKKWVVTVCLGGIYNFRHECCGREDAILCGKRVSKGTEEAVDVWCDGNIVQMFKRGKRY